jgi:hypothetical protein
MLFGVSSRFTHLRSFAIGNCIHLPTFEKPSQSTFGFKEILIIVAGLMINMFEFMCVIPLANYLCTMIAGGAKYTPCMRGEKGLEDKFEAIRTAESEYSEQCSYLFSV